MSGWTPDLDDMSPEEADLALAGEYVLGLLEAEELRSFEARLAAEPSLRARVAAWADDLAALTDDAPAVLPSQRVEIALKRRLFPDAERPGPLGWLKLWPLLLGGVVAAALAVVALNPVLLGRGDEPDFAARVAAENGLLVVEARFDADTRRLEVQRTAGDVPENGDLELWLVQGEDIRSLGVLPREEAGVIEIQEELAAAFEGGTLAVSEEPLGGSPTGRATGPVVALGPITSL